MPKNKTLFITGTALMSALVYVSFFINIRFNAGSDTMLTVGNVTCVVAGLILGPVGGGLAAGIGGLFFDLLGGWASTAVFTMIIKFALAFVCGAVAFGGRAYGRDIRRNTVGAAAGLVVNVSLTMLETWITALVTMTGAAREKALAGIWLLLGTYLFNAVLAVIVGVPLAFALRKALGAAHIDLAARRRD
ncbi:MAG: ECF transporter S component [Defluviitaleaceae bacterium]|nr:ECF transporter S component [Defluviitaleaceae bacterium]